MTRPAIFTQSDITKLLKGAKAAGVTIAKVEIDRTGKIVAQIAGQDNDAAAPNEWDTVFNAQEERPAKGRH